MIKRDCELKTFLERDNHLREIYNENQQFIKNSIEKIKLRPPDIIVTQNIEGNTKAIKRTYSIDGNKGINSIDIKNIVKNDNYIDNLDQMEHREISPNISGILNKENKLSLSQNYFKNNEKEIEEFP